MQRINKLSYFKEIYGKCLKEIEIIDIACVLGNLARAQIEKKNCPNKSAILDLSEERFMRNQWGEFNFALINRPF